MLESALAWLLDTVREHGPLLLFLAAFLENAAFLSWLLPGEKLVLVGGYLVQQGELGFELAWLAVFLGVMLGDTVGYFVGRYAGAWVLQRLPGRDVVARVEGLFQKYGGWVVLFGRFSGILRPALFLTIGMMKVPYRKFWLLELVGAAAWTTLWLGMGVLGGSAIDALGEYGQYAVWLVVLKVAAFGLLGGVAWKYRERIKRLVFGKREAAAEATQPAA
ncbi:MAG: DedA family protein [Chloroflexota bacterium]